MLLAHNIAWDVASDMAKHSISEAAKLTGKARSTLHRHLKDGKLSKELDTDGQPVIDTAELVRVYGPLLSQDRGTDDAVGQQATAPSSSVLQAKIEALLEAQIDQLRKERVEQINQLRADLEDARKERDNWKTQAQQLSALLSDQRPIATAAPAPEQQQEDPPTVLQSLVSKLWKRRN